MPRSRIPGRVVIAALLSCFLIYPVMAQEDSESDSLFGLDTVTEIEIRIEPDEWAKLQPSDDVNWDIGQAMQALINDAMTGEDMRSEKSSRPGLAGYMGIDHQYGRADVVISAETVAEVGVRYKGNGTFASGFPAGKPSFKIDFNEYRKKLAFRGLKKINLNNNDSDPSYLREALSYELFREAGIPAPRVGWARVVVAVGDKEPKAMGLYTLVEQVDKRFLKRHYGTADGLLIKPSTFGTFRHFGDVWSERYERAYVPKTEGTPEQQQHLVGFARLLNLAGDDEFEQKVDEYLDVDQFVNFLAVNVLLSNLDSFLGGTQNYYAYLEPRSNLVQLLPWDMDHSFGAFELLGTPEERRDFSLDSPAIGENSNRLIERTLAIPRIKAAYHARIEELLIRVFAEEKLLAQIQEAGNSVRPLLSDDEHARFDAALGNEPTTYEPHVLKYFVKKRLESVRGQLDGKSDGQRLSYGPLPGVVEAWIRIAVAGLVALVLNALMWVWGLIAGFRKSSGWGFANLFLYPIAPVYQGFVADPKSARRMSIGVAIAVAVLVAVVGWALTKLS